MTWWTHALGLWNHQDTDLNAKHKDVWAIPKKGTEAMHEVREIGGKEPKRLKPMQRQMTMMEEEEPTKTPMKMKGVIQKVKRKLGKTMKMDLSEPAKEEPKKEEPKIKRKLKTKTEPKENRSR